MIPHFLQPVIVHNSDYYKYCNMLSHNKYVTLFLMCINTVNTTTNLLITVLFILTVLSFIKLCVTRSTVHYSDILSLLQNSVLYHLYFHIHRNDATNDIYPLARSLHLKGEMVLFITAWLIQKPNRAVMTTGIIVLLRLDDKNFYFLLRCLKCHDQYKTGIIRKFLKCLHGCTCVLLIIFLITNAKNNYDFYHMNLFYAVHVTTPLFYVLNLTYLVMILPEFFRLLGYHEE